MVSQHLGIAEAYKLIDKAEIKTNKSNDLAWRNVIDKYKESKINSTRFNGFLAVRVFQNQDWTRALLDAQKIRNVTG